MHRHFSRTILWITGMRDNDCRERLTEALDAVRGVIDVDVALMRGQATVTHEPTCTPLDLLRAVGAAGYAATLAEHA